MVVDRLIPIVAGFFIDLFSMISQDPICLLDLEIRMWAIKN